MDRSAFCPCKYSLTKNLPLRTLNISVPLKLDVFHWFLQISDIFSDVFVCSDCHQNPSLWSVTFSLWRYTPYTSASDLNPGSRSHERWSTAQPSCTEPVPSCFLLFTRSYSTWFTRKDLLSNWKRNWCLRSWNMTNLLAKSECLIIWEKGFHVRHCTRNKCQMRKCIWCLIVIDKDPLM